MSRTHRSLLFAFLTVAVAACGDDAPAAGPAPVAAVQITAAPAELLAGATGQVSARVLDAEGDALDRPVTWTSSDAAVATVSASGLVTAVAPGEARIGAAAEGRTASTLVRVRPLPVPAASVTITTADPLVLRAGLREALTAVVRDANGAELGGRQVTWRVLDANVVALQNGNEAVGFNPGETKAIASVEGVEDTITVRVDPLVARVVPDRDSLWVAPGGVETIAASARDAQDRAVAFPVTYLSSDPTIATVDAQGRVTGVRAGRVQIRARAQGVVADVFVEVVPFATTAAPLTATLAGEALVDLPTRHFVAGQTGALTTFDVHGGRLVLLSGNRYRQEFRFFVTPFGQVGDFADFVAEGTTVYDRAQGTIVFTPNGAAPQFRGRFREDGSFYVRQFVLNGTSLAETLYRVVP